MIATRREVLSPDEPGGLPVAVRSDAFWVHKTSERVTGVMDSEADVSRLRLLVEGSRRFEADGGTLTPYTGLILGEAARTYRAGTRWQVAPEATLLLEGARAEGTGDGGPVLKRAGGGRTEAERWAARPEHPADDVDLLGEAGVGGVAVGGVVEEHPIGVAAPTRENSNRLHGSWSSFASGSQ